MAVFVTADLKSTRKWGTESKDPEPASKNNPFCTHTCLLTLLFAPMSHPTQPHHESNFKTNHSWPEEPAEGSERAARDAGSSGRLGCVSGPSQSPGIMSGVLPSLRDGWITVTSARAVARDFQFWRENVKPSPFHRRKTLTQLVIFFNLHH